MKYYIQFLVESSGVKFNHKTNSMERVDAFPIDLCGSDGIYVPDGRYSINTIDEIARHKAHHHIKNIIGYEIRRSIRYFSEYTTIKKVLFN